MAKRCDQLPVSQVYDEGEVHAPEGGGEYKSHWEGAPVLELVDFKRTFGDYKDGQPPTSLLFYL